MKQTCPRNRPELQNAPARDPQPSADMASSQGPLDAALSDPGGREHGKNNFFKNKMNGS